MDIADHIRRDPEEGARRLVSELGPSLYGVALRLVGDDRAAADDLYMRALECAFAKIVQYRGDGLFLWLRAILVNIRRMEETKGQLIIDYYSVEELEQLAEKLDRG